MSRQHAEHDDRAGRATDGPPLVADAFMQDPRMAQARQLIREAMLAHQSKMTAVRQADPSHQADYDAMLETFARLRGGGLYYPYLGSGFGNGCLVELADGSVKYDFITGIGPHGWGHGHPDVVDACVVASCQGTVMQGNLQQTVESMRVAEALTASACSKGAQLAHCFLTSSGAMANENALKLVFANKAPADRLLAFEHGFAGRTLALASVTDNPAYRRGLPPTLKVDYVPFYDAADPDGSTDRALRLATQHLARYPEQYAGMLMELVQGESGYYPGSRSFFEALIDLLHEHGVAVIFDEIQTFGRTSEMFAFQHFGLDKHADVVTIGKLSQVCATLFTDAFKPTPGLISQTFTASSTAIAATRVILHQLSTGDFYGAGGRITQLHDYFANRLDDLSERYPGWVTGPFGIGAMIALTPFDGRPEQARALLQALFKNGVIAFVAGAAPTRVRFLMPLGVVTEPDIDAVCRILENTLIEVADAVEATTTHG
jgi:acetylornithine aminotransferase